VAVAFTGPLGGGLLKMSIILEPSPKVSRDGFGAGWNGVVERAKECRFCFPRRKILSAGYVAKLTDCFLHGVSGMTG
jgi:hypothetical protein